MITFTKGDATRPKVDGPKIIVHVCSDVGGWGKGFVMALSKRWKTPEKRYRSWFRGELPDAPTFELGRVQFVNVESDLWVANVIGQKGQRPKAGVPPIRYEAIRSGLAGVRKYAKKKGASVHMPRIGCGLAGGKWEEIEPIIQEELDEYGISVTVYDFG